MATTRLDRRTVLVGTLLAFVLLNLVPAFGAGFPLFAAARAVTGAVQGLFIAAAIVTATAIVPPERAGRAMAIVIAGFATSNAFGLPLGTLLGAAVGWRWSFVVVLIIGCALLSVARHAVPSVPPEPSTGTAGLIRFALAPRVLAVLGIGTVIFAAILTLQTYLVPYLKQVSGITGPTVGLFLLGFGVATTIGSLLGGRLADWNAGRALTLAATGVAAALLAMFVPEPNRWPRPAASWRSVCSVRVPPPLSSIAPSSWPARRLPWWPRCRHRRQTSGTPSVPRRVGRRSASAGYPPSPSSGRRSLDSPLSPQY